ncbi:putative zinc-binding protein [Candidatus Bathyarchaeota archaeon]|nr:putative zinc-binding protein [Candidatus Bathyarchaeota archaeon]
MSDTILIIPCSGIGKSFGTISRDATYGVVEELKKGETDTLCLSLLVMGDKDAELSVKSHRCIAMDGCPNECAKKNLELSDAKLVANFRVVDVLRKNRGLKPNEVTFLDKDGRKLSKILAEKIASKVDELNQKGVVS